MGCLGLEFEGSLPNGTMTDQLFDKAYKVDDELAQTSDSGTLRSMRRTFISHHLKHLRRFLTQPHLIHLQHVSVSIFPTYIPSTQRSAGEKIYSPTPHPNIPAP